MSVKVLDYVRCERVLPYDGSTYVSISMKVLCEPFVDINEIRRELSDKIPTKTIDTLEKSIEKGGEKVISGYVFSGEDHVCSITGNVCNIMCSWIEH